MQKYVEIAKMCNIYAAYTHMPRTNVDKYTA